MKRHFYMLCGGILAVVTLLSIIYFYFSQAFAIKWEWNHQKSFETCYVCGITLRNADEWQVTAAQYENWPNHWVSAHITLCLACVSHSRQQHKQDQIIIRRHWVESHRSFLRPRAVASLRFTPP